MAQLVHSPHALLEAQEREEYVIVADGSMTIADHLIAAGIDLQRRPHALYLNGKHIPIDDWDSVYLKPNDFVTLRAFYHGGGSKSNPLAIVAMIALAVVAPYAGAAIASSMGLTGTALQIGTAIATGLVSMAGSMLIAALFPPAMPKPSSVSSQSVSPTYSIDGARNTARAYQPIPVVFGTHKFYPDVDSQPYTAYEGNEQYLHMTFNFGWIMDSGLTINELKIGDTPIDEFDEVEYQWSDGTTGQLTLFPTAVTTVEGAELKDDIGEIIRRTPKGTTKLAIDLSGVLFRVNDAGNFTSLSCEFEIKYRPVGGAWQPFVGNSNYITWTNANQKPVRRSYYKNVPQGEYEVYVRKVTADPTGSRQTQSVSFGALRAFKRDEGIYERMKRLAVKIRASGQLQGTIDALNAIVTQNIPAYDGGSAKNSNPASIFRAIATGLTDSSGEPLFGAQIDAAKLDSNNLTNWGDWCETHDLECNFVFDQKMSVADMLLIPGRVGRGMWSWATGKLGVVWDEENKPVTQIIAMENIIDGSFEVQYTTEKLVDEVIVTFINPDIGWAADTVRVLVPGVTNPTRPATLDISGITDLEQAAKEANLVAARQFYHKRRVTLEMDSEALVATRGDVVQLTHDMTNWGQSARILSGTTTQLTLTTPIQLETGTQYYCGVRKPDGTIYTLPVQDPGSDGDYETITLASPLDEAPGTGPSAQDWIVQFDIAATPGRRMKIVTLQPLGIAGERVRLELIDDNPLYYAAEGGSYNWQTPNPNDPLLGQISNVEFAEQNLGGVPETARVTVSWDLTQATGAGVRWRKIGDATYTDLGNVVGNSTTIDFTSTQSIEVELTPSGAVVVGPRVYAYYTIKTLGGDADNIVVPDITGLTLTNGDSPNVFNDSEAVFTWDSATANITDETPQNDEMLDEFFAGYRVEVWDGTKKYDTLITETTFTLTAAQAKASGIGRTFEVRVFYEATTGQVSATPASLNVSNPAPDPPAYTVTAGIGQYWVQWEQVEDEDLAGYYVFASDTSGFTPGAGTVVYKGNDTFFNVNEAEGDTIYIKIAAYDTWSDAITELSISNQDSAVIDEQAFVEEFGFSGLVFTPNSPSTNQIAWTAGTAYSKNDGTTYSINAGNATWTTGQLYIVWQEGTNNITSTTSLVSAVGIGPILGIYKGGNDFVHGEYGDAFIDGGKIIAQTVGANQVVTSGLITDSAQINSGLINTAHIQDAAITNVKIGNTIQSSNWNATTKTGWKLDKAGTLQGRGITIYDNSGNVAFSSGGTLDWSKITGSNKPDDNADVTALNTALNIQGQGAFATLNQITAANIGTYMASAAIGTAYIGTAAITNAKIGTAAVDTLKVAGEAITIPRASYNGAYYERLDPAPYAWHEFTRITFASGGNQVFVSGTVEIQLWWLGDPGNGYIQLEICRIKNGNVTVLRSYQTSTGGIFTLTAAEVPGTGNITYLIRGRDTGTGAYSTARKPSLYTIETKR